MNLYRLALAAAAPLALAAYAATGIAQTLMQGSSEGSPIKPDADGAFAATLMFGETSGEALYQHVCAGCHMPDGKGAVGAGFYPALAGNTKLGAKAYPAYVVLNGLNGMPPVGDMMSDEQVAQVVNYVRTHLGNNYKDTMVAAEVKALR